MAPNLKSYPLAEKCATNHGKIACFEVLACFVQSVLLHFVDTSRETNADTDSEPGGP